MLNAVVEIAIGLIVLYSMLSLVCSKTNELLATVLSLRARNLRKAIGHLVGDAYTVKVYEHPLITSLYRGDARPDKGVKKLFRKFQPPGPSYLPAQKFVIALLDTTCPTAVTADPPLPPDPGDRLQFALAAQAAAPKAESRPEPHGQTDPPSRPEPQGQTDSPRQPDSGSQTGDSESQTGATPPPPTPLSVAHAISAELTNVTNEKLMTTLETLWRAASYNVVTFRAGVEQWFDHTMDRASGWYRRQAQVIALFLGLLIAVAANVDTVHVTERLWSDGPLRSAVLEQVKRLPPPPSTTTTVAGAPTTEGPPSTADLGTQVAGIQSDLGQISGLQLPLGWDKDQQPSDYRVAVLGWLLTAIALSLGAPFWFDLLNKVTALRSGGTKETTPTQSSKPAGAPK